MEEYVEIPLHTLVRKDRTCLGVIGEVEKYVVSYDFKTAKKIKNKNTRGLLSYFKLKKIDAIYRSFIIVFLTKFIVINCLELNENTVRKFQLDFLGW